MGPGGCPRQTPSQALADRGGALLHYRRVVGAIGKHSWQVGADLVDVAHPRDGWRCLQHMGLVGHGTWDEWAACYLVAGRILRPGTDPSAATNFAKAVTAARWRRLVKHRSVLQGLQEGRDEEVVLLVGRDRRSPVLTGMLWIIQSGSIYAPSGHTFVWAMVRDAPCATSLSGYDSTTSTTALGRNARQNRT